MSFSNYKSVFDIGRVSIFSDGGYPPDMKPWSFDVDPSNQYPRSCCFCSYEPKTLRLRCLNPGKTAREFFRFGARIFCFPNQKQKNPAPHLQEQQMQKFWHVNRPNGDDARAFLIAVCIGHCISHKHSS